MRKALVFSLIAIIAISTLYKGLLVGYYVLNKEYIAANLCENRDTPALKCDGKCYLKRNLRVENNPTETKKERNLNDYLQNANKSVFLYCQAVSKFPTTNFFHYQFSLLPEGTASAYLQLALAGKSQGYSEDILHPPAINPPYLGVSALQFFI